MKVAMACVALAACSTAPGREEPDAATPIVEVTGTLAELAPRMTTLPSVACLEHVARTDVGVTVGVHGATVDTSMDATSSPGSTWLFPAASIDGPHTSGELLFDQVAYQHALDAGMSAAAAESVTPARWTPCTWAVSVVR